MSKDTIYRQDAIDALCKGCGSGYCGIMCDDVKAIKALPSAQPEITDEQAIDHLQESGWMQNHDEQMYEMGLKKQLADDSDSYDALLPSAQSEPQWTPCSEGLPEPNRRDALNEDIYYLVQTGFGDMIVASYNRSHTGKTWWEQMYAHRIFNGEIIAWMPLPKPWKGVEE